MQLNTQASFEVIHGALCQLMTKIGAVLNKDFYLNPHGDGGDAKYFPQRGADVILLGKNIGTIGVLHPEVLKNFELKNPVSMLELEFQPVWEFFKSH
jgi:phenylalanyl-tRNA synthetase beta chain